MNTHICTCGKQTTTLARWTDTVHLFFLLETGSLTVLGVIQLGIWTCQWVSFSHHSSTWLSSLSSPFTSFSSPPPSHSRKSVPHCARLCSPGSGNRAPQCLTAPHSLLQCPVNNYARVWVIIDPTSLPRASTNAHTGKKETNRKLVKDQEPEGVGDESFRKYQLSNN